MTTSKEWFERAKQVIPGGVSSPVRAFKHVGATPVYFAEAKGPYLFDVEGRRYTDFCLGFGPHILGHSEPRVMEAVSQQLAKGTSFGACHPKEVELIEQLLRCYPYLGKGRLVNTGTEAVMTAVRLARGYTGRNKIIKFEGCYHGHSDGFLARAGSGVAELAEATSKGVPASLVHDTLIGRYDDLSTVRRFFDAHPNDVAAILVEPIPANDGLWIPKREWVKDLYELGKAHGALIIFDEVITGFRLGLGGATAFYDLEPDLVTLGKVIGGGLPLAAVLGRQEIMSLLAPEGPVYQAGTFSGNILSVVAGLEALKILFEKRPEWNRFDERCEKFAERLKNIVSAWGPVDFRSLGSVFWFKFGKPSEVFPPEISPESKERYAEFFAAALAQGIYFPPSPYEVSFISFTHTDAVLEDALTKLGKVKLPTK